MRRFAAISGRAVGSEKLWMSETHVHPQTVSANHHHGESETAIFVLSGHPDFVFHDGEHEVRIATNPGDYVFIVFIPPYLPHREENPSPDEPAIVVIARSTQEAIVVNLPGLYAVQPRQSSAADPTGTAGSHRSTLAALRAIRTAEFDENSGIRR